MELWLIESFFLQARVAYKVVTNKELTNEELQAIVAAKKGEFYKEQCKVSLFFFVSFFFFLLTSRF